MEAFRAHAAYDKLFGVQTNIFINYVQCLSQASPAARLDPKNSTKSTCVCFNKVTTKRRLLVIARHGEHWD